MENISPSISQNERLLAAASHASILMPVAGSVLPFAIWVSQKEKSQFVREQSLQALVHQLSLTIFFVISMGCLFLSLIARSISISFETSNSKQFLNPLHDMSMLYPLLINTVVLLGLFLFSIYGIFGAVKAFQGKPFQYIFIGNQIKKYTQSKENADTIE